MPVKPINKFPPLLITFLIHIPRHFFFSLIGGPLKCLLGNGSDGQSQSIHHRIIQVSDDEQKNAPEESDPDERR